MSIPAWEIVNVRDTTVFDGKTGAQTAYIVTFRLPDGAEHEITIPHSEFNPDNVHAKVHDHATKLLQVKAMQGPMIPDSDVDMSTVPMDFEANRGY